MPPPYPFHTSSHHSPSPCRPGWARPAGAGLSCSGVCERQGVVRVRRVGGRPGRGAGYEGAGERRDKRPFLFRAAGCLVPPLCTITPHLRQAFQSRMRVGRGGGRVLFVKGGERACKATSRGAGAGMGGVNKRPVFFRARRSAAVTLAQFLSPLLPSKHTRTSSPARPPVFVSRGGARG